MSAPTGASSPGNPLARVLAYHERTKHHTRRFANGPGGLDWESQPDPFRTYAGAARVELPLTASGVTTPFGDLGEPGRVPARALEKGSVAALCELALGLTAWKEYGEARWALRANPSSGNLHPTEGYLVLPALEGIDAGVYHYVSRDHALEQRCALDPERARELAQRLNGGFLVGLSSIHWREAWKYGERAFRYCQHDIGHALASVRYAAATLGWSARLLDGVGDTGVARVLGLDRDADFEGIDEQEREHPDALLVIAPNDIEQRAHELESTAGQFADCVAGGAWAGRPNELSSYRYRWTIIDDVAEATWSPGAAPTSTQVTAPHSAPTRPRPTVSASELIRQRRSAVELDGSPISAQEFYAILERTLPACAAVPFDMLPWKPRLHLGLFVHRVEGLAPGVYIFERHADIHEEFASMLGPDALLRRPDGCPEHLRLFALGEVDCRRTAASVSCGQDIAADGAFSLGMLAEYRATLEAAPHNYRRLFWESGAIGQVLYLEAEALGIRGTGIGCYFDDAAHDVFGLEGDRFQSLYHFTLGGPIEDTRLVTHPPYAHLGANS